MDDFSSSHFVVDCLSRFGETFRRLKQSETSETPHTHTDSLTTFRGTWDLCISILQVNELSGGWRMKLLLASATWHFQ